MRKKPIGRLASAHRREGGLADGLAERVGQRRHIDDALSTDLVASIAAVGKRSGPPGSLGEQERAEIVQLLRQYARPLARLNAYLQLAGEDDIIAQDAGVVRLVALLSELVQSAQFGGGPDYVLRQIGAVGSMRAAMAARATGEDLRERVLEQWLSDVRTGGKPRGRPARIARRLKEPERTVRDAVATLRRAGRIQEDPENSG